MTGKKNNINIAATDGAEQLFALRRAYKLIESDPYLQHCLLDTSADGKTLLVFCGGKQNTTSIEQIMRHVWHGNVEVLSADGWCGAA